MAGQAGGRCRVGEEPASSADGRIAGANAGGRGGRYLANDLSVQLSTGARECCSNARTVSESQRNRLLGIKQLTPRVRSLWAEARPY